MASIQIQNSAPFGAMTNRTVGQLIVTLAQMQRLQAAVANAASGFGGTAGTEYENALFGVTANDTPGQQGAAYAYAVDVIAGAITTFLGTAEGAIASLDNGN